MKIYELIEGVEYNRINSGYKYKLEDGKLLSARANKTGGWSISLIHYNDIKDAEFIESPFEPKQGNKFYYPDFMMSDGFNNDYWDSDSKIHHRIKNLFGIYRTFEQAEIKAKELGWI